MHPVSDNETQASVSIETEDETKESVSDVIILSGVSALSVNCDRSCDLGRV